jgi:macrolide transport system ATP-binding/permease protein
MSSLFLKFNNVSFRYENAVGNIFQNISFQASNGWTGLIGVNGSGKTTLLKLACGILKCRSGVIEVPANILYNEQRTNEAPARVHQFLNSYDKYAFQLINELEIENGWINRWDTLSHGERKRVQIACALWSRPDLLAADEPTNHLDQKAKDMIYSSLKSFKGIGLIVSHDRDMMEKLCEQFLFVEPGSVELRKGKLNDVNAQRKHDNEYAIKTLELKKLEINRLEIEYKRRSEIVDKAKKKSSKRNIDKKDKDSKAKIDFGRLTGKDAVGGKLKTTMQTRLENAKIELQGIEVKREYKTGIMLSSSVSKRNYLLNLEQGTLQLSDDKKLCFNNLVIAPRDKIALTGKNGSGKSTLVRFILKLVNAEPENITYIPQEISIDETIKMMNEIRKLPNDKLGRLLIIVSRLGSDAKRILETDMPSPGEIRKLFLGLGIERNPHIIIMDEPTNHMDIASIECLEDALQNITCALLLVSHDKRFLKSLTKKEWMIKDDGNTLMLNG